MDYQRRQLLAALGAGMGLGAAGCLSRGDPDDGSADAGEASTPRAKQAERVTAGEDAVVEQQEPLTPEEATMSPAETRLAATTERIMDELDWFATEYDSAIERFRDAGDRVVETVAEVGTAVPLTAQDVRRLDGEIDRPRMDQGWPYDVWWAAGEKRWRRTDIDWQDPSEDPETPLVAASAIESLREEVHAFADTFEEALVPHFSGAGKERQFGVDTVDVIERFNELGDAAMVVAGLVRLYEHYETVTGGTYIQENLSDDPIRNRLAGYLAAPDTAETPLPPLFEVDYRGGIDHKAFAHRRSVGDDRTESLNQAEPLLSIDGSTGESKSLRLHEVVDGLEVGANRTDKCYCLVSAWFDEEEEYYSADLSSQSIFIQRYRTAEAAEAATERLLGRGSVRARGEASKTVKGNGDIQWQEFTFRFSGERWYGIHRRVGRHVLIASVGRQPFEHRNQASLDENWERLLGFSWLGANDAP